MNENLTCARALDPADDGIVRVYDCRTSITFRKTNERFGGLSNLAAGLPLDVNGVRIRTSEALFEALRFPHLPHVQRLIIDQAGPMAAKRKSKLHRVNSRGDWDLVRVSLMRWCLQVKLANNLPRFGALLRETGDRPIVEDSHEDDFWGTRRVADGSLVGQNVLGRLLMDTRGLVRRSSPDALRRVDPPGVLGCQLYGNPIREVSQAA